jgi:transposase
MFKVILERCAGIDVGKRFVVVCLLSGEAQQVPHMEKRQYDATVGELERLRQWLVEAGCTHVVLESTGSYWKPVFNVLEKSVTVVLANPAQVKNLRGHKTDRKDSEWLAYLLRHGMVRPSFIPPPEIRELRSLTRQRRDLVAAGAGERNRVQRLLEEANIKLGNVLSDVFGVSGQRMLEALVEGKASPAEVAQLAVKSVRRKIPLLEAALEGHRLTDTLRFLIAQNLRHMEFLELEIARLDEHIAAQLQPFARQVELLKTLPGVDDVSAATIVGEVGVDMMRFPTAPQLASWAGLCPGNNESAGKRKSGRIRHGNATLRATLNQCAWAAAHTKGTRFRARYEHLVPKRGKKRAIVATAHQLLTLIHLLLSEGVPYQDQGWQPRLGPKARSRRAYYHLRCLYRLGCNVPAFPSVSNQQE